MELGAGLPLPLGLWIGNANVAEGEADVAAGGPDGELGEPDGPGDSEAEGLIDGLGLGVGVGVGGGGIMFSQ